MSDFINTLTDECFFCIFNHVPLYVYVPKYIYVRKYHKPENISESDDDDDDSSSFEEIEIRNPRTPVSQLHLDQVCKRWSRLLLLACARRTTLAITLHGLPQNYYEPNATELYSRPFYSPQQSSATLVLPFLLPHYMDYRTSDDHDDYEQYGREEEWLEPSLTFLATLHDSTEEYFTERARYRHARHDRQLAPYLAGLFPKVRTLVVTHMQCFEGEVPALADLLGAWPALKNLKLWIRTWKTNEMYRKVQHPVATHLLPRLNQLAPLQQLILLITGQKYSPHTFPVDLFAFVEKHNVVKLNLFTYDKGDLAWDMVHRFRDTKWHLISTNTTVDNLSEALNPQFEFANKQAHFYRQKLFFVSARQFGQFCWKIGDSLGCLRMIWKRNITYTQLVTNVALLTRLHTLELTIKFGEHRQNAFTLEDGEGGEQGVRHSLPQVKNLKFDIEKQSHHDFESFCALAFPSVEEIIVANSGEDIFWPCVDCLHNRAEPINGDFHGRHFDVLSRMTSLCRRLLCDSLKDKFGQLFWVDSGITEDRITNSKSRRSRYRQQPSH